MSLLLILLCATTSLFVQTSGDCPAPPSIQFGAPNTSPSSTVVGGTITYVCEQDYVFPATDQETMTVTCEPGDQWSNVSDCEIKKCPDLATTYNLTTVTLTQADSGMFQSSLLNAITVRVKLACIAGHEFNDSSVEKYTQCQLDQKWTLIPFNCEARVCPPVYDVNFATRSTTDNWYPVSVNYTCNEGYFFPDGSLSRVTSCNQYGRWSEPIPHCTDELVDIKSNFVEQAVDAAGAISFGLGSLISFGALLFAVAIWDCCTIGRQIPQLKRNLARFTCCQEKESGSEIDSLDGDEIMRQSVLSFGKGKVTPSPSTYELRVEGESKASGLNKPVDVEAALEPEPKPEPESEHESEHESEPEPEPEVEEKPRLSRISSAKNAIQRAMSEVVSMNNFVRGIGTRIKNQFTTTNLPLAQDNYGKIVELQPQTSEQENGDNADDDDDDDDYDDSSEYTDASTDDDEREDGRV